MTIKITPNDKGNPPGKLADAELHFSDGPLEGLKLIGFAIWERRGGNGAATSRFPARQYSVNGERRSFALLRPIVDTHGAEQAARADPRGVSGIRGAAAIAADAVVGIGYRMRDRTGVRQSTDSRDSDYRVSRA